MIINTSNVDFSSLSMGLEALSKQLPQESAPSSDPSSTQPSLLASLDALAMALNNSQADMAKIQAQRSTDNAKISAATLVSLNDNLNSIRDQIEQIAQAQANQSWWQHFADWMTIAISVVIVAVVITVSAVAVVATGGAALPAVIAGLQAGASALMWVLPGLLMATSDLTGLTAKAEEAISNLGHVAAMLVNIVIFISVAAATFVMSGGTATGNLAALARTMFVVGSALLASPQLLSSIMTVALDNSNMSDDDKKHAEWIAQMVQLCVGGAAALSGGLGLAFSKTVDLAASTVEKTLFEKMMETITTSMNKFASLRYTTGFVQSATQAAVGAVTGNIQFGVANSESNIAQFSAENTLNNTELKAISAQQKSDIAFFTTQLRNKSAEMNLIIRAIEIEGQSLSQALAG